MYSSGKLQAYSIYENKLKQKKRKTKPQLMLHSVNFKYMSKRPNICIPTIRHRPDLSELCRPLVVVSAYFHHREPHLQSPGVHDLFDSDVIGQCSVPVGLLRQEAPQVVLAGRLKLPDNGKPNVSIMCMLIL